MCAVGASGQESIYAVMPNEIKISKAAPQCVKSNSILMATADATHISSTIFIVSVAGKHTNDSPLTMHSSTEIVYLNFQWWPE